MKTTFNPDKQRPLISGKDKLHPNQLLYFKEWNCQFSPWWFWWFSADLCRAQDLRMVGVFGKHDFLFNQTFVLGNFLTCTICEGVMKALDEALVDPASEQVNLKSVYIYSSARHLPKEPCCISIQWMWKSLGCYRAGHPKVKQAGAELCQAQNQLG